MVKLLLLLLLLLLTMHTNITIYTQTQYLFHSILHASPRCIYHWKGYSQIPYQILVMICMMWNIQSTSM